MSATRLVIIGGMHRSGTSLTASIFDCSGFCKGSFEDVVGLPDNVKGFFEHTECVNINELILKKAGVNWRSVDKNVVLTYDGDIERRIISLVDSLHMMKNNAFLKDPRFTFTAQIWKEILYRHYNNLEIVFVACVRWPVQTLQSLAERAKRDGDYFAPHDWNSVIDNYFQGIIKWRHNTSSSFIVLDHKALCFGGSSDLPALVQLTEGKFTQCRDKLFDAGDFRAKKYFMSKQLFRIKMIKNIMLFLILIGFRPKSLSN